MKYLFKPLFRTILVVVVIGCFCLVFPIIGAFVFLWHLSFKKVKSILIGDDFWEWDMNESFSFEEDQNKIFANPIDYILNIPKYKREQSKQ